MASVREIFRVGKTTGDIGLEIEVEGQALPGVREFWLQTEDGSLRPHGDLSQACEYVLKRPLTLPEARKALDYLDHRYDREESVVKDSARCGVHVHVNCQELSLVQLYNFITLYLMLEELLVRWCGEDREGNLFCLRAGDAEFLTYSLAKAMQDGDHRRRFDTDRLRYSSLNLKALPTYGSLEFRSLGGTRDMDRIYQWVEVLHNLREKAVNIASPDQLLTAFSVGGGYDFLDEMVGREFAKNLRKFRDWEVLLKNGMRLAQDVAFAAQWEEVGRPKREVGGLKVEMDWDDDWPPLDF